MKLAVLIALSLVIGFAVYTITRYKNKKKKRLGIKLAGGIVFLLITLSFLAAFLSSFTPDAQCTTRHITSSRPPTQLQSASDYFQQGNYDYDSGNCAQAIADYSKSIHINPAYFQAFNNRAYTYMRMQDYKDALPDLDTAIQLNPNYVQALMNRGDIHNYYYQIDKMEAITDYKKVLSVTGPSGGQTSVCGHLLLARHNGWNLGTVLDLLQNGMYSCQ